MKKRYRDIAEVLSDAKPVRSWAYDEATFKTAYNMWYQIVQNLAVALVQTDPGFDARPFLDACGVRQGEPGEKKEDGA